MFYRETNVKIPSDSDNGAILTIVATHFVNEILLQIRYNGEIDVTYEVSQEGLRPFDNGHLAGHTASFDEEDEEDNLRDNLANYKVVAKLGDSNDAKLPVICTQIAELYRQAILPKNIDGMGYFSDGAQTRNLLITMSSKFWKKEGDNSRDFEKLVFVLKTIREMYN